MRRLDARQGELVIFVALFGGEWCGDKLTINGEMGGEGTWDVGSDANNDGQLTSTLVVTHYQQ